MTVCDVQGLSVSRVGGATILDDITFSVARGECVAIVGESGAGKSVLARTLLGLTQVDRRWAVTSESLGIAGRDMRSSSPRRWRALRGRDLSLILQDALQSLDPLRTIGAEVGETLAIRGIRGAERRDRVREALKTAGLPDASVRAKQRSGQLSGGQRQRALIASALIGEPQLIIADEPTTALDPTTATRILDLFNSIKSDGTSLLFISHDLESVARAADRVIVLDRGRIVEAGATEEILKRPKHPVTQQLLHSVPRGPKPPTQQQPRLTSEPSPELVTLRNVVRVFPTPTGRATALDGVDLTLHRGEAVGIVGESGAGKTTLARILVGADRPTSGSFERIGSDARIRLIPQDAFATFDPRWSVERIITTSNRLDGVSCADLLTMVGLDPALATRRPVTLSGGQRQRVAIARALATDPDILVCDEPVSALDVSTQAGILQLLRDLQASRGLTIVFVSHDLAAVRTVCDRLLIMRDGRVIEEGQTEEIFTEPREPFTRELMGAARHLPRV